MEKNYAVLSLIGAIAFFGYISCALGGDKMEEEYIVTINEIEIYNSAATALLQSVIKEEKKNISIVDKSNPKNLNVAQQMLKPEMDILINNSKNMADISELFKTLSELAKKAPNKFNSADPLKDKNIILMKIGSQFCLSNTANDNEISLCINGNNQVTKITFYPKNTKPNYAQMAIPVDENNEENRN